MSLDLYIYSKTPVKHKGTGVFVRVNGETKELTLEEIRKRFPDVNIAEYPEFETEDSTLWSRNITHNLTTMAQHVKAGKYTLYQLLWHPEETNLVIKDEDKFCGYLTNDYRITLMLASVNIKKYRKSLQKYNPENGWGTYEQLVKFTDDLLEAINDLEPIGDYKIEADT